MKKSDDHVLEIQNGFIDVREIFKKRANRRYTVRAVNELKQTKDEKNGQSGT